MPQQSSDQQPPSHQHLESLIGLSMILIIKGLCATVEVFLHKPETFGERYAGPQVVVGFLLILAYPVFFWQGEDPTPLHVFLACYTAMLMWVRFRSFMRSRRGGPQPHSRYAGTPRLLRILRRFKEETVLCIIEPSLVIVLGGLITELNEPLGAYLLIAGFALMASTNMTAGEQHQRAMRMHDAHIDQQNVVQTFRERRGR